jgi:hypothetical protein
MDRQFPFETTLLKELDEIATVRYLTFDDPVELSEPLAEFIDACAERIGGAVNRPIADGRLVEAQWPNAIRD